ncbi:hypothetical protein [Lacinutrix salivirga]
MKKALKIGVIVTLIIYGCGLAYTYYSDKKFTAQFEVFDADKNGTISGNEVTEDAQLYLNQKAKRKTLKQGVILLIPVALVIGIISFAIALLFSKMKKIDDNEINYGSRN